MQAFLERTARSLLEHHPKGLERVAVVLPGRRAGLHLRKYLANIHGGPLWSPEIWDMGSFMERMSGLAQGGSMELLSMLYEAHVSLAGDRAASLLEFLEWAPVTLRDMSEVDAHLLDHVALYRDLREYHELEEWSFRLGELSPGQRRLNGQWRATGDLHRAFSDLMRERRLGTSGYVARACATELASGRMAIPWEMVWFVGLNALDPASTSVITHLRNEGRGRVVWDADPHYLEDPRQEAGRFLRRSILALGAGELPPQADIAERERTIRKVATPHSLAQTTYVAQRLSELTPEERSHTAVVLADEDLLLPLLQQLPSGIGPLNVTMGMPLKILPVTGLTETFLELLGSHTDEGYRLDMLEKLLLHPFLEEGSLNREMILAFRAAQRVRITGDMVTERAQAVGYRHHADLSNCLSPPGSTPRTPSSRLRQLLTWARSTAPRDSIVQEQLFQMARLQQRLDRTLERFSPDDLDLRTYSAIRMHLLREERITFLGEPLQGLQVMGLLETRALDHERAIIVSMNEGVLPRDAGQQSWIPFDVRRHHRLPVPADGDAISAYHFHRAMQHADHVEWVFVANGQLDVGEPSRFIAQWEKEVVGKSRTRCSSVSVAPAAIVRAIRPITVTKDEATMKRLESLCEQGLSPSALGAWLRCPLDFYFRYVLRVREDDRADGKLGSDVLGDAVHHVLQELLRPTIGTILDHKQVTAMIPRVDGLLADRLSGSFPRHTLDHGHLRLRRSMAAGALQTYLRAEAERCGSGTTSILAIEQQVQARLSNGVLLKGRLDRIDRRDGTLMLLDVKTGSVTAEDLRLSELSREAISPKRRYALQLLVYAWAYMAQDPDAERMSAGVIPLQRASQATADLLKVGDSTLLQQDRLPEMDALLSTLVNELLDPSIPFTHDPDSRYCRCCVA